MTAQSNTAAGAGSGAGRSAIFGVGYPLKQDGQVVTDHLRASGFTTVILFALHVHPNGDLYYNDDLIVSAGRYVGDPGWPGWLRTLKQAPTSVNRVEFCVGGGGVGDWRNIKTLIAGHGTGPDTVLYRNLLALQQLTGVDAIDNDDESCYDLASTVAFAKMAKAAGFTNFTLCPYLDDAYWRDVRKSLGPLVDRVYLQAYAGGAGNDPAWWTKALGMPVDPGLWCTNGPDCAEGDSPADVERQMRSWHASAHIPGGFIWCLQDLLDCLGPAGVSAYARAINDATGGGTASS